MSAEWSLRAQIVDLERRVSLLEGRAPSSGARADAAAESARSEPALRFLSALEQRRGKRYGNAKAHGAVGYAGSVNVGPAKVRWAQEHPLPALLSLELALPAAVFASLGSLPRLTILRHLLVHGPADRSALAGVLENASTGQLYHHLQDLQAQGLIAQRSRGLYVLVPHALVPLLTLLAAGRDLGNAPSASERPGAGRPKAKRGVSS